MAGHHHHHGHNHHLLLHNLLLLHNHHRLIGSRSSPRNGPTRTVAENTAANQNIQHPVSATDDDGDRLTYRLSGTDANSFTIVASNGQLGTRSGITYKLRGEEQL